MFKIILALILTSNLALAGSLQNTDFATPAQITGAGGSISQLLHTGNIYDQVNSQLLDTTLAGLASGSGVTSLAAFGSAPNANGGSIAGQVLTLQPANATNPGGVTTGAQTFAGTKTFSSTISGSVNGNAATVTTNANLTGPITSVGNATSVASQTGTGSTFVMNTSPTLVTPVLGVAAATSINKVVLTAPATGSTLTILDGKTFTCNNTLTLAGTDGSTLNVGTGGTLGTAAFTNASAYEVPLTFSTGLTRTVNTVTVNTSQNISTLSNLTTNGYVKTSGGTGALSVQTAPIPSSDVGGARTINAQVGTSYTFVLADGSPAGGFPLVTGTNASAETFTVPPQSSVTWVAGTQLDVCQLGAGKLTLAQGAGVTINSFGGNKSIGGQYVCVTLVRTASDTWLLAGNLIP